MAAERAEIAIYNDEAPVGSGSKAAEVLKSVGLLVSKVDIGTRVASTRVEAGAGAQQTAMLVLKTLGLPSDALVVDGESSSVQVLLGPDARIPKG